VWFDVPIGKDGEWTLARVPGLRIDTCQRFGQRCTNLHTGQLAQKVLQRQVLVRETIQAAQACSLVVV